MHIQAPDYPPEATPSATWSKENALLPAEILDNIVNHYIEQLVSSNEPPCDRKEYLSSTMALAQTSSGVLMSVDRAITHQQLSRRARYAREKGLLLHHKDEDQCPSCFFGVICERCERYLTALDQLRTSVKHLNSMSEALQRFKSFVPDEEFQSE